MKTQIYECSLCKSKRIIKVKDNVCVQYIKCNNSSCERSIIGIAGGMRLKCQ